mmetsp:Transcript_33778/g.62073  ORF Transcript_33778/g.62073 Transcript_33778/m.62073 type:complete len:85 (-) Transcript_33778:340-594(-)
MSGAGKAYTILASYYHWAVAAPLMGSIASVLICQQSPKSEKGKWMYRHKSLGLITASSSHLVWDIVYSIARDTKSDTSRKIGGF